MCPSCQLRAGGETTDFGEGHGGAAVCATDEAPLTEDIARAFELPQLRSYLASPRMVVAEPRNPMPGQPALEGPVEIVFDFELGDFKFAQAPEDSRPASGGCSSVVWAPVKLTATIGAGVLSFSTTGSLWKAEGELAAHLYASADLATATGSYRPKLDPSRPHIGQVEVVVKVFPDQLRGSVIPELFYFKDQQQLERHESGKDWWAYESLDALVQLDYPKDDDCADSEQPLALDTALQLLGGKSPAELRREVVERLEAAPSSAAVWRDSSETVVSIELSESPAGSICLDSNWPIPALSSFVGPELVLRLPVAARLRSADAKIDMTLDELIVTLGKEQHELRAASLQGRQPRGEGEQLDASIRYTFKEAEVSPEGIVYFQEQDAPGSYTWVDCLALPPGGKNDTGECRYVRR